MKTVTPALLAYLNSFRPSSDLKLDRANLYTITLSGGAVWTFSDRDIPFQWNGYTYSVTGLRLSGLRYKSSIGVDVDRQQVTINAAMTDTFGGIPFLKALRQGVLDGAQIQRESAFYSPPANGIHPPAVTPIGTVVMFKGRVSEARSIGRTTATIDVASETVLLDIQMPRNTFKASCVNEFCDSGCTLSRAANTTHGNVEANSTLSRIYWSGSASVHVQGSIAFSSGPNAGSSATIKKVVAGSYIDLSYPLQNLCTVGDAFDVLRGCDHTIPTCTALGNVANYRGFPYIPSPQIITGPMASQHVVGGK